MTRATTHAVSAPVGNLADLSVAAVEHSPLESGFDALLTSLHDILRILRAQLVFVPQVAAWFAAEQ